MNKYEKKLSIFYISTDNDCKYEKGFVFICNKLEMTKNRWVNLYSLYSEIYYFSYVTFYPVINGRFIWFFPLVVKFPY